MTCNALLGDIEELFWQPHGYAFQGYDDVLQCGLSAPGTSNRCILDGRKNYLRP